jgi:uncharacterized membrane protein YbhN (UPF0104 family)
MNLFLPFGPGELGTVQMLKEHGAPQRDAAAAVFYSRVVEILSISAFLIYGFIYLGWGGAVEPFFWTIVLIAGVVSLTRPLGRGDEAGGRFNYFRHIWTAYGGRTLADAIRQLLQTPGFFIGTLLLSMVTFGLEIFAFWSIKQAFSSPMDDYVLMKDLTFIPFMIAVSVAALARVIPYTFAGFGIVEFVLVSMFRVFDQGFLGGTTVALLSALLMNGMTFLFFLMSVWITRCPSILETWHVFFRQSVEKEA